MLAKSQPRDAICGIRAISFDGDDTLWDFESAMLHGLGCVLEEIRRRVPGDAAVTLTVQRLRALRDAAEAEMPGATLEAIRMEGMRRAVAAAGGSDDSELEQALFDLYVQERYDAIQLYPDAQPTIEALGPRFPLAIVSNGNTDVVRLGLQARFAVALYAAEVGYAKPDPRIFHLACQLLGCAPCELLHVGDSLETDVAGAQAARVRTVWLNRSGWGSPPMARLFARPRPDYTITSLQQLLALLEH
ncbi:MAG: HAD family hydrolase [Anaerolineae bacterium]